jgi:TolB-like protein/DNA-binding SARP family transcriptional activator/Tfp pilus assembly protein PilF
VSKIQLKLLGHFDCLLSSCERITLSMRKAEVLLAYLALAPGQRHPRDRLVNLLWSDRSDEQARNSLRQCLSAIKKSLGPSADTILLVDRSTVSLNAELIDVDLYEFERLATVSDIESLSAAAGLYQGEFLEGISIRDSACQEWLDSERGRFKRQFIEILSNLAETQLVTHDFGHAITSAERLVEQDPLGESGWRLLMRSYAGKGDRNHALIAYKRCSEVLQKELGVEPEAATIELQESIKAGDSASTRDDFASTATPRATPEPVSPSSAPVTRENSILVLPLQNLSDDSDQQYFSDGLTESIIMGLSLFPYLRVHSRNSSFAARDQKLSIQEIGNTFDAQYVVEGSVRRSQDHIRVSAQLIDTHSGEQIWNNRIDNKLEETFALEDQITRSIVAAIKGKIDVTDEKISIQKKARDIQSYDLLLQGTHHLFKFNPKSNLAGIELLLQCLEIDDDNPRALLHLYQGYIINWISGWSDPRAEIFEQAGIHIKKAFALASDQAMVQASYAEYNMFCHQWDLAEIHAERALRMNPNDPEILATISPIQASLGNIDRALELADACHMIDPFHPWVDWVAGVAYYSGKKYSEALQTFKNMPIPSDEIEGWIAASYHRLGDHKNAAMHLGRYLDITKQNMARFPSGLDEWEDYWRSSTSYRNEADLDSPFQALCEAGLKAFVEQSAGAIPTDKAHNIAVLPFDNLSGDPEQEYFSDGITDSIILNLSLFPGLNVKSRNSSFAFKQQIKSLGEISTALDVDYIVEGSIRKSAERIRITVQLIEAANGNQVWGKRYDAEIEDLFDLEEELSRTIVATITGMIDSELQLFAIEKGAVDQQAYDLFLAGRYYYNQGTQASNATAIELLKKCIDQDPENASAHALLSNCHDMTVLDRWTEDVISSKRVAAEHIHKAVAIAPDLNFVRVAYAGYLTFQSRYEEAENELQRVLERNPNDPEAITMRAVNLSNQGKSEAALEQAELVLKLDPYHPWVRWIKSEALFLCGRYDDCLETIASINDAPGFIRIYKVAANVEMGRLQDVQKTMSEFLQFSRDNMLSMPQSIADWRDYYRDNAPFADPAINDRVIDLLVEAGLEKELNLQTVPTEPGDHPSILVLPFDNLSGDPEQEYFSNGITESIILTLSSSWGITVKSRHTSFAYQNSTKSIRDIGDELDVPYIVEGSIRKHQDQVRITVQLVEASGGNQIWGKRYDQPLDELFEVEDDLVRNIAAALSGRIGREVRIIASKKPASDMKSFDYLMRGWYYYEQHNPAALAKSVECLKKCIELDLGNVDAHAFIAGVLDVYLSENWCEDREQIRSEIEKYIQKALLLDQKSAFTHSIMSDVAYYSGDPEKGLYHADRAIELDPTLPDGYIGKALNLVATGDFGEAVELADFAMQLDQFHNYSGWGSGEVYRCAGDYKKAIAAFSTMSHMPPSLRAKTAACLVGLGQLDKAKTKMAEYLRKADEFMPLVPASQDAWRSLWRENLNCQADKDFEVLFDQLLQAGLCDGLDETTHETPSIAVLPFENMSGDPEQEYFSDGITSDIISILSKFSHMSVVARHSTMPYKTHPAPISQIAKEQGVRYILEGSVRKSGDRIRVTAELIDSQSEQICWNERYDRDLEDMFTVQDEMAKNIALAMKVHLDDGNMALHRSTGTTNIKAWQLTLEAVDLQDTYIRENILEARALAKEATRLDPGYPYAWVSLGWTYWQEVYSGWCESFEASLVEAEKANQQALNLVSEYSESWSLKGLIHLMKHEPAEAQAACRKAVELEPGNAEIQALMAFCLIFVGDYEGARQHNAIMFKLCPVLPNWYYLIGGEIALLQGDLEIAKRCYQQGIDIEPESPICRFYLIDVLMDLGDESGASKQAQEIRRLDDKVMGRGFVRTISMNKSTRERFQANLEKFDLY